MQTPCRNWKTSWRKTLHVGQSMRNRPKRVATKSPILFNILPVIGLYVKFNMCQGFFFHEIQQKLWNI
jgi:hypothetical protein